MSFPCKQCGLCCQHVGQSKLYQDLDRGDGCCRYFDDTTNLCRIYDHRPLRCNVDVYYDAYLKDRMTREAYYKINQEVCQKLQRASGENSIIVK